MFIKKFRILACGVALCTSAAVAQNVPHETPPPASRQDQQPAPNKPDQQSPSHSTPSVLDQKQSTSAQPPTGTLADTQQRVQDALLREMPAGHGNDVKVSVTDDGSLQLTGSVDTAYQKQRAEDIARSATSNQSIVNKIDVNNKSELSNPTAVPK